MNVNVALRSYHIEEGETICSLIENGDQERIEEN